jgi:hypothetical protein
VRIGWLASTLPTCNPQTFKAMMPDGQYRLVKPPWGQTLVGPIGLA